MNKHILKCISNYDMKVEGSLAYGQIDGYEVNVLENKFGIGPIFLFSASSASGPHSSLSS